MQAQWIARLTALALTGCLLLAANGAYAIPVTWTLNDWRTDGGETVTGSFVYDADTDTFSSISVSDSLTGSNYSFVGPTADANNLRFVTGDPDDEMLSGTPAVFADLQFLMTNLGGTLDLEINPNATIATCTNADCQIAAPLDNLFQGSITGVPVPEPSTAALLTLGLMGVAAQRRRR